MAKRDKPTPRVPHLKEVYHLAQVLSASEAEAHARTVAAYQEAADLTRFGLLAAALSNHSDAVARMSRATSAPEIVTANPAGPPLSLLARRMAEEARKAALLRWFVGLPAEDRALLFLNAHQISNGGDLGRIFGLPPETCTSALESVSGRLERGPDLPGQTPSRMDLLSEALKGVLTDPGPAVREASLVALKRPNRSAARPATNRMSVGMASLRVVGILALAVVAAFAVTRVIEQPQPPLRPPAANVLAEAAETLPQAEVELPTRNLDEAHVWLRDRVGWQFRMPRVAGVPLNGVGLTEMAGGVLVPTIHYGNDSSGLSIGIVNYALLDRESNHLTLDRGTLDQLAAGETPEQQTFDGHSALVVRHRDDLYLAVSDQIDIGLANRISFPD